MIVEGTDETTGATIQARSSFLPDEISWGRRLHGFICVYEKQVQVQKHGISE